MKKKNVLNLADTIFWYFLYFFPVVAYLLFLIAEPASGTTVISLDTFFSNLGIGFITDNFILSSLSDIFGANGVMPFFANDTALYIFTWFICVYIVHLAVDFLIFIPRLAHKYMNYFTRTED